MYFTKKELIARFAIAAAMTVIFIVLIICAALSDDPYIPGKMAGAFVLGIFALIGVVTMWNNRGCFSKKTPSA